MTWTRICIHRMDDVPVTKILSTVPRIYNLTELSRRLRQYVSSILAICMRPNWNRGLFIVFHRCKSDAESCRQLAGRCQAGGALRRCAKLRAYEESIMNAGASLRVYRVAHSQHLNCCMCFWSLSSPFVFVDKFMPVFHSKAQCC